MNLFRGSRVEIVGKKQVSTANLQGGNRMRRHYDKQRRFDCTPVGDLMLNYDCRDEVVPVLAGLQQVYTCGELRRKVVKLVAEDINEESRRDVGRPGLDDWQIVVLAAVRLGCNYDYDKLQDQAENHRALRTVLCLGEWDEGPSFRARRIRDTLCQLQPSTLEAINQAIVSYGQQLHGTGIKSVRADSFVVETDIHYPTESSLIGDGMRKIIPLCINLASVLGEPGWRQSKHLQKRIKEQVRTIAKISASKSPGVKKGLLPAYRRLLDRAATILERAKALQKQAETDGSSLESLTLAAQLQHWIELTEQVCDTAHRRVILGEKVPNSEKLFSLFETHTQLYRRGKAGTPNQFGRQVLVFEDGAGFISHYHLMDRELRDADVIVEQTREAQKKHQGMIQSASFDRGFYSEENERQIAAIVDEPCLPPRHPKQYAERLKMASLEFRNARQSHPGIESAIGALQSGNGLKRCRDHSDIGFERYLGLAILGRNIHVLGRLLIARRAEQSAAALSKRKAA
jgi:IS5 family transposase